MGFRSTEVARSDGALLAGTEDAGLEDDALRFGIEAVAMAVRAQGCPASDNRITSLADFVSGRVGSDFGGGGRTVGWWGIWHGIVKKAAPVARSA